MQPWVKTLARKVFSIRIPATRVHRALVMPYLGGRAAWFELQRIFFFQPLFEALCASVGAHTRVELCPDSKLPMVHNADLHLGERVRVSGRTSFSGARNAPSKPQIRIGDDSYVGHRCVLRAGTSITIGKHVLLASNALLSGDPGHPLEAVARRTQPAPAEDLTEIVIEDDVWLAYNVTVVGNVRIGRGAVVAANAVVTKDVPPFTLVAGNPARVIRSLAQPSCEVIEAPVAPAAASSANPLVSQEKAVAAESDHAAWLQAYRSRFYARYAELFLSRSDAFDEPTEQRLQALWGKVLEDLEAGKDRPADAHPPAEHLSRAPSSGAGR